MASFLLGGYTADTDGNATGIGVLHAGETDVPSAGGPLAFAGDAVVPDASAPGGIPDPSPSWLTRHPSLDVVYAALEKAGRVQAFRRIGASTLVPLGPPVEAGAAVCHAAVAPDGRSLIATCWGDGRVVRMSLDAKGSPSAPVIAAAAADPYADAVDPDSPLLLVGATGRSPVEFEPSELAEAARSLRAAAGEFGHLVPGYDEDEERAREETERMPVAEASDDEGEDEASTARVSRAHESVFLPGGLVATTDMGLDLVRIWRVGESGLRLRQEVVLPRGSGPRHMVWHPSGHLYVVTELSCEVYVLAPDRAGSWRVVSGTTTSPGATPGVDQAAEIALARDGEFVYAALRGSNTIATLRVTDAGAGLSSIALVESGVDWPRHHLVVRDILLVAGQRSDEVVSLTLDIRNGVPGRVRHRTEAPTPTCLLPLR